MNLELRHLRVLVEVVDAGTFTEAAVRLGVSQAAVSRSIQALEDALGARLLQRSTRHVHLTGTGTRILGPARQVLDEVAQLHRIVERSRRELRVGYAWSALGKHTRRVQKAWPGVPLVFVQSNTPTAGLGEGLADVGVLRRPLRDARFETEYVGEEARCAAVSTDSAVARKRTVRLADLSRYTVAIDERTGTTTPDLWPAGEAPAVRHTHGVDEWLVLIAAGQAVGITSEATAHQNPRPGVAYRRVRDAPPIGVWLAWWRADPPSDVHHLVSLVRAAYGR